MSRWLALPLALLVAALMAPAAAGAPRLCTGEDSHGYSNAANGPNPRGVTVTHLYAKINGVWREPDNVCVAVRFETADRHNRYIQYEVWNSTGFFFDLTDEPAMPAGTPVSLGLEMPVGAKPVTTAGQYRDGIAAFGDTSFAVQGKTAPWTYVDSAYNEDKTAGSGATDCRKGFTTFRSTFGGFIRIQSLTADGSPAPEFDMLQDSFMEGNGTGQPEVSVVYDAERQVSAVQVHMEGCGDKDPTTLEGHFRAFVAKPALTFLGLPGNGLGSAGALLSRLMDVRDPETSRVRDTNYTLVKNDDLAFEPIAGVSFPPLPSGPGPQGVMLGADFSYSSHNLLVEPRKANVAVFKRCKRARRTPKAHGNKVICVKRRAG